MKFSLPSALALLVCCIQLCLLTSCLGQTVTKIEKLSPTARYRAELSEGDTGAVGGWESAVRVSETAPSTWSRLLGHDKETVFGVSLRSTQIAIEWTIQDHLVITCIRCDASKIELQKHAWKEVLVSYKISAADNGNR